ncbi:NADP-dependent malic enzyme [Microbaculum marinum]|uniref:NADP-dependent malic enzyme n=1 Tax=Microbaculum marinum TaxID=1764581 RepID=A0AAW9RN30_9HYPH
MADLSDELRSGALVYHRLPRPGKLEIRATKPLGNNRDLALAYSPGVAAACEAIELDPSEAANLTARQNLVAVISNGTAVLGLGAIGPLASKPVMEGKAVLFKKFAGIDVFDIEIDASSVERMVDVISALEPTFGGINLEDIRAPECFEVEARLRERMNIPVFHDDQHGTAIIVSAAVRNALKLAGKKPGEVKVVTSGAGAAALACLNLLVETGVRRENIWVCDIDGVVYSGRQTNMDPWKAKFAQETEARTLADVIAGADIFLGLSVGGVLKPEMVVQMAEKPLIMALANPVPEIMPEAALEARPDAMMCTGRSDYPNQVNNVLCFPFIFRGALDVGATDINEAMKLAAATAIADLAHEPSSDVAARAVGGEARLFGADNLIPNPFDPRLILRIAPAVARAAMETGVAARPIDDFDAYDERLNRFVFRSGFVMKPIFAMAKDAPKRVIYAEGEDERILRAAQVSLEEGIGQPILVGRPGVVETRLARYGLSIRPGVDFEIINPEDDPRYRDYVETLLDLTGRKGVTPDLARTHVRTNATVIAALALHRGEADAMVCGVEGRYESHLHWVRDIIGTAPGVQDYSALSLLILPRGAYFIADTYVTYDPTAEEIANTVRLAAAHIGRFGIEPKFALLSHSNFGSADTPNALKMRHALRILEESDPEIMVEGEMHGDVALDEALRNRVFPRSRLKGEANVFIMPSLPAANIAYQLLKGLADALPVGPILIGGAKPAHILTPSVTARGVVNMTAIAVAEAQQA